MAINIDVNAICPNKQINVYHITVVKDILDDDYISILNEDGSTKLLTGKNFSNDTIKAIKNNYAMCEKIDSKGNAFCIYLNMTLIERLWEVSWLKDYISKDVFTAAFTLHELAHVRYTDFYNDVATSFFKAKIRNILEDARVEYMMSYDFPETSIFFNVLLSSLYDNFKSNFSFLTILTTSEKEEMAKLICDLYNFARYNLIDKDVNKQFISEAIPLILLSRRGLSSDCDIAAEVISNLINKKFNLEQISASICEEAFCKESLPITKEDRKEKLVKIEQEDEVMKKIANKYFGDDVGKQIEDMFKKGKQAGSVIELENKKRTPFFLQVANEHRKEIETLRNIFVQAFTDYKNVMTKDGDINFMRQQEAYINSITGVEGNDYQFRKKEKVLIDVVLLRDVSHSVYPFSNDYAKAIVIFLCALENVEGVRTAQIDFNGIHVTNKTFESSIDVATINPYANGGTSIRGAYDEVLQYKFKGKRNLVVVISDGQFSETKEEVDDYEEKINSKAKILKYGIGGYTGSGYTSIEIKDIPQKIVDAIIKEGLQ